MTSLQHECVGPDPAPPFAVLPPHPVLPVPMVEEHLHLPGLQDRQTASFLEIPHIWALADIKATLAVRLLVQH